MTVHWQDYIEQRNDVMLGKPVFKGTRLAVEHILKELGTGMSQEEVLEGYPQISREHLSAAMLLIEANPTGKFIVITDRKVRVRTLPIQREK